MTDTFTAIPPPFSSHSVSRCLCFIPVSRPEDATPAHNHETHKQRSCVSKPRRQRLRKPWPAAGEMWALETPTLRESTGHVMEELEAMI